MPSVNSKVGQTSAGAAKGTDALHARATGSSSTTPLTLPSDQLCLAEVGTQAARHDARGTLAVSTYPVHCAPSPTDADALNQAAEEPAGGSVATPDTDPINEKALAEQRNLLAIAKRRSQGKRPDGRCLSHVWKFLWSSGGYGKLLENAMPNSHRRFARQFAEYANANLEELGLKKLPIDNPYDAPAGAIVVVRAGTPGTAHPRAGDIAIAGGDGKFYNGGVMSYRGPQSFPPGNNYVLGIYVPA